MVVHVASRDCLGKADGQLSSFIGLRSGEGPDMSSVTINLLLHLHRAVNVGNWMPIAKLTWRQCGQYHQLLRCTGLCINWRRCPLWWC